MGRRERTVRAVEFQLDALAADRLPSGPALVEAAAGSFDRVLVHAHATADGWAVVHPRSDVVLRDGRTPPIAELSLAECAQARLLRGARLATLEETMLAGVRSRTGLVVAIHETHVIGGLAAGLGILGGEGPADLRTRYLVLVPDGRIGKRLRREARDLPSALRLRALGGGPRGALGRRFPNLARAAADADDLLVPAGLFPPGRLAAGLVPQLTRRGAFVWVAGALPRDADAYEEAGVGGLLQSVPWTD